MTHADGVLPSGAVRSPFAHGALVFVQLKPDLDADGARAFLTGLSGVVDEVTTVFGDDSLASIAVGFADSFFRQGDQPRFGLDAGQEPAGLLGPPALPPTATLVAGADLVVYLVTTAEAVLAQFFLGLAALRMHVVSIDVERGFQRANRRELGGFLDGLRNANDRREAFVFVDRALQPEEPVWADGGTYVAYLKIPQDLDRFSGLEPQARAELVGRRIEDGSRLDRDPGASVDSEGEFTAAAPAPASHVRKAGPRGAMHDDVQIFRRGLPFVELNPDGTATAGLQFVSFQRSLDLFDTIFNRWMLNEHFPTAGTGPDALVRDSLISFWRGGFFFVPPHDDRFIGAGIFDSPTEKCRNSGRLIVRKHVNDTNGNPIQAERGGISFQMFRKDTNEPIGPSFQTSSEGRAVSPELPIGVPLVLREVGPPDGFDPAPDQDVTLDCPSHLVDVTNTVHQPVPGYGG